MNKISEDLYKLHCYFCKKAFKLIEIDTICYCKYALPKYSYFSGGLMHMCYKNMVLFSSEHNNINLYKISEKDTMTELICQLPMNIYNFNFDKFEKYILLN